MEYELHHQPAYALAEVSLDQGETLETEAGAMVTQTETVSLETGIGDEDEGLLSSVKDSVLGDESLFRNRLTAEGGPGVVEIAPVKPGDIQVLELDDETVYLQSGSYVASAGDLRIDSDVGGLDSVLGGEGLFFLKAHGTGHLFVSSFGGIQSKSLDAGERLTVDSGHAVGWSDGIEYTTRSVGGLKESLFSGEGRVMEFTGPGTVLTQTRAYDSFVADIERRINPNNNTG